MGTHKSSWFDWTDERIAQLKALYADGLSSSQIAAELGGGLTRNSIIGKVNRLGLTRDNHPSSAHWRDGRTRRKPIPASKPRIAPTKSTHHTRVAAWRMAPVEEPAAPIDDNAIPIAQRKTLLELENHHCRWPLGDGPAEFFCAHPSADLNIGIPYCRIHGARAYQPNTRNPDNYVTWGEQQPRRAGRARA